MSNVLFKTKPEWSRSTKVSGELRVQMLKDSGDDPDKFWRNAAERLDWFKAFDSVQNTSFERPVKIQWYKGGELNAAYNCVDRHLPQRAKDTAFRWVPENQSEESLTITYQDLSNHVNRLSNAMHSLGVKKGDRVTIYMPMIPEAIYSMLACARIGAIHSVIFGGFSPNSIADRIKDCRSDFVITADEGIRAGKKIPLKKNVDAALELASQPDANHKSGQKVRHVLCVRRTGEDIPWHSPRDVWYHEVTAKMSVDCPATPMNAEDPLFILYTSGSTGKPKGVLHTTGGYLTYVSLTHEIVFDYKEGDVYWCAADVGWVTGHSYMVYGPLCNGATSVIYEGLPSYPTPSRIWEIVDQEKVNILYTAPTLIRALMREGDEWVKKTSRNTLKVLGSVGEPINPEAWLWYYNIVGSERCPIVDTWWQTETGGIVISPLPGGTDLKPGSASFPIFEVGVTLINDKGEIIEGEGTGHLCLKRSWPGQMRTVFEDHARFEETYFSQFPGYYYAGDECHRDQDGYLWIIGRADDVINVSGHRMGTAEVESALVAHPAVTESAVVGFPHEIKGQGIYAFVTLKQGLTGSDDLKKELVQFVRKEIGPVATPDKIQWAPSLPKTRSGKIMRRILKKIAANDTKDLGDITTLADPQVVQDLVHERQDIVLNAERTSKIRQ